jgi:hypothetical protein
MSPRSSLQHSIPHRPLMTQALAWAFAAGLTVGMGAAAEPGVDRNAPDALAQAVAQAKSGGDAQALRVQAEAVAAGFLAVKDDLPREAKAQWVGLLAQVAPALEPAQLAAIAPRLSAWLAGADGEAMAAGIPGSDAVLALANGLAASDQGEAGGRVVMRWLAGQQAPPTLGLPAVAAMVGHLGRPMDGRREAIWTLAATLHRQHLADPAAMRAVGFDTWKRLLGALAPDLDPDTGRDWAGRVRLAFAGDDRSIQAMDAAAIQPLADLLAGLDRESCRQVLRSWYAGSQAKTAPPAVGIRLAATALWREPFSVMGREDLPLLPGQLAALLATWDPATLDLTLALDGARMLWAAGEGEVARRWVDATYSRAFAKPQPHTTAFLTLLATTLAEVGLARPDKDFPGFAQAVVAGAAGGWPDNTAEDDQAWARLLVSSPSRATLAGCLLDDRGMPRPRIAALLAWSSRNANALEPWAAKVADGVRQAADGSDLKAMWLIAQAYVDEQHVRPGNEMPGPVTDASIRRFRALKQALGTAQSAPVRLAVIQEMARYFRSRQRPGQGAELIASIQGQFTGPDVAVVARVRQDLLASEVSRLMAEAREESGNQRLADAAVLAEQRSRKPAVDKLTDKNVQTRFQNELVRLERSTVPAMQGRREWQ